MPLMCSLLCWGPGGPGSPLLRGTIRMVSGSAYPLIRSRLNQSDIRISEETPVNSRCQAHSRTHEQTSRQGHVLEGPQGVDLIMGQSPLGMCPGTEQLPGLGTLSRASPSGDCGLMERVPLLSAPPPIPRGRTHEDISCVRKTCRVTLLRGPSLITQNHKVVVSVSSESWHYNSPLQRMIMMSSS